MAKKRWLALLIAAILFFVSIVFQTVSSLAFRGFEALFAASSTATWEEKIVEEGNHLGKIVILEVNGVIQESSDSTFVVDTNSYNHRNFIAMLDHAASEPDVEGILIRIDSPGGGVVESDEIYRRIVEIKEKYEIPVYVSMGSMAASGGYYIAASADKIFAHASTITGSLGVIMQSINVAELADRFGVKMETIKSGPYKDIMSQTREMTEEERQILQSIIDESYEQFVEVIAEGRKMDKDTVRSLADGRIYSGKQAVELNLVDELGTYEDALRVMKEEIGLGDIDVVKYQGTTSLSNILKMTAQKVLVGSNDLLGIKQLLSETNSPSLMYLYTGSR